MKNADQPIYPCMMQRIADGEDKGSFRLSKPGDDRAWTFASSPLTKREEFARSAMQGLLSNPNPNITGLSYEHIARQAAIMADIQLNELEK